MTDDLGQAALIARIRDKVSDPTRRVDSRPSQFWSSATTMSLDDLSSTTRSLMGDLGTLLRGGPTEDLVARAEGFRASMETPADKPLPAAATPQQLREAERRLGVELPALLRRLYLEVANGGFGPGSGLLGVAGGWTTDHGQTIEDLYAQMIDAVREHDRWVWPKSLVPVLADGTFTCVDASTGSVVEFDFEELGEGGRDGGWSRAFSDRSPSLETWLTDWLDAPDPAEQQATEMAALTAAWGDIPEVTRAYWAEMSPEERATYGLPEKGWGRALFGDAWGDDRRDGSGEA